MCRILKAIYWGWYDGLHNTDHRYKYDKRYVPAYQRIEDIEDIEDIPEVSAPDERTLEEIAGLEMIIKRLHFMGSEIEKELNITTDLNKRLKLMGKLNTLDSQAIAKQKRLNRLKDMVEGSL